MQLQHFKTSLSSPVAGYHLPAWSNCYHCKVNKTKRICTSAASGRRPLLSQCCCRSSLKQGAELCIERGALLSLNQLCCREVGRMVTKSCEIDVKVGGLGRSTTGLHKSFWIYLQTWLQNWFCISTSVGAWYHWIPVAADLQRRFYWQKLVKFVGFSWQKTMISYTESECSSFLTQLLLLGLLCIADHDLWEDVEEDPTLHIMSRLWRVKKCVSVDSF